MKKVLLSVVVALVTIACSNKQNNYLDEPFVGESNRYIIDDYYSGMRGYINKKGEVAIKPQFVYAKHFREGLAVVADDTYGPYGYIDTTGRVVIEKKFADAEPFSGGMAPVKVGEYWGFINRRGDIIIQPKYKEVMPFSEGLAAVQNDNERWGFINNHGEIVVEPQFYTVGSFFNGLAIADGGYIGHDGKYVISPKYIRAFSFNEGRAIVCDKRNLYSIIDTLGNVITTIKTDQILNTRCYCNRISIDGVNNIGRSYVDGNGNVIFKHNNKIAGDFRNGLARFCNNNNRWGYIDTLGRTHISARYLFASDFEEGLALVAQNENTYSYIDKQGNIVYTFVSDGYFGTIYMLSLMRPMYDLNL